MSHGGSHSQHGLRAQLAPLRVELEQALDGLGVALSLCDSGGTFRWINAEMAALVGQVVGRHFSTVVAPEYLELSVREFARKTSGEAVATTFEVTLVDPAGQRIPSQARSVALRAERAVVGVFGAVIPTVDPGEAMSEPSRRASELTPRQRDVLSLLAEGFSTREIASRLGIAEETVRNHIRALLRELGVHSRLAAVAEAQRQGLL